MQYIIQTYKICPEMNILHAYAQTFVLLEGCKQLTRAKQELMIPDCYFWINTLSLGIWS